MFKSLKSVNIFRLSSSTPNRCSIVFTLLLLYLPIIIYILPLIISSGYLFKGDYSFDFAPLTATGMRQWKAGDIPLWSTLIQCGFPLLAEGMGALLYPPLLLFHLLFPESMAFKADIVFHLFIAPLTMFSYCRSINLSREAAILGCWLWIITGPFLGNLGSPAIHGITWLPLLLYFVDTLFNKKKYFSSIAFLSLFYSLGWVGGLPQIPVYSTIITFFYLIYRVFERSVSLKERSFILLGWLSSAVIGVGIGSIQLLPLLEAGKESVRAGGVDYLFATYGSLFPTGFAGFIMPSWTRLAGYWLSGPNIFTGFIVIALILLTFPNKSATATSRFFWILLLIGCFLSMGKFNPIYRFIYHLPGLHFLRAPSRFMLFTQLSLSILGASGFDYCFTQLSNNHTFKKKSTELLKKLSLALAIPVVVLVTGSALLKIAKNPLFSYAENYVNRAISNNPYSLQDAHFYHQRIVAMFHDISSVVNPFQSAWIISVATALGAILTTVIWIKKKNTFSIHYPLLFLCIINFSIFIPNLVMVVHDKKLPSSSIARYLSSQTNRVRLYNVNYRENIYGNNWSENKCDPNFNMFHGIENVGVYSSLGSLRYFRFLGRLGSVNLAFGCLPVTDSIVRENMHLLNFCNTGFLTSDREIEIPGVEKIPLEGPPYLYKNNNVLPRALVVRHARIAHDTASLLSMLHASEFNPEQIVYLEEETTQPLSVQSPNKPSIPVFTTYTNRNVEIEADGPGWLVVADLFYPGWKATINTIPTKIYRANYAFRAVYLDPGKKHITFTYLPDSFKIGVIITLVSLIASCSMLLLQYKINQ